MDYLVKFKKPYNFDGEEHEEIDLSELNDLKGSDLTNIEQKYNKLGYVSVQNETSLPYAFLVASHVTNKPIEFFENLPAIECSKIKNRVAGFLFGLE